MPLKCRFLVKTSVKLPLKMTVNYEICRPRRDGLMRVSLVIFSKGTKKRVSTDILLDKSDLTRKGLLSKSSPKAFLVQKAVRDLELRCGKLEVSLTGGGFTSDEIFQRISDRTCPYLFDFAEGWISRQPKRKAANYNCAVNSFRSFLGGNDIRFDAVTYKILSDYSYSLRGKERAQSLYLGAIRHLFNEAALVYDFNFPSPFTKFKVPRQRVRGGRAVSLDTIKRIFSYSGTSIRGTLARDCAMLSFCLMGMNSADLYEARIRKNGYICYNRQKTRERRQDEAYMEVKIPKEIRELMKRYKDTTRVFDFHKRYSDMGGFNKSLNIGLGVICRELGIKEDVTFYSFRHSWATIARNNLGIDRYTVNEALCHISEDIKIVDTYIKKDFTQINIANRKVLDYVFG